MALMQSEETLQTQQKQLLVWRSYVKKRGDVYLWLRHVVKPMSNGSSSPSVKLMIK